MMISTKGRYALRVMVDICEHDTGDYITLKDIAARQEISEKYLESIISVLSKADILNGLRGKGGGYRLTRKPEEYSVGEILRLVEGPIAPVACLESDSNKCTRSECCSALPMWEKLNSMINSYLDSITLDQLIIGGKM